MKTTRRRVVILALFAALVLALLWFQGILFRHETPPVKVPAPPAVAAAARTAKVEQRNVAAVQAQPGFVEAIDPAPIAPRVMATVLEIAAREGESVPAGAVLAVLDDRDARSRVAQARAAVEAAHSGAQQAELAFARAQKLLDAGAATRQDWETARAALESARAQLDRAREAQTESETALSWYRLTAPFAGRVLERRGDPGQLATPGVPLLTLYREDQLRFSVALPEERAAALPVGAACEVTFDSAGVRRAHVARALPSSDPATGTVTLHLALEQIDGLRPGLLGRLQLQRGERSALVVPAAAVERVGQVERVQLVRDGRAVPVVVRTGKSQAGWVEVLGGLSAGESVVVP
jgi:RND family efflux transporter MFP subunit